MTKENVLDFVHVDPITGCWNWLRSKDSAGRGQKWDGNKLCRAYRLVYTLLRGPIPDDVLACHNCPGGDNPGCVNPNHIFLGTHTDNMQDAARKGRVATGEAHWHARFTADQVREIRIAREQGSTYAELAARFHTSEAGICKIVLRHRWRHVV